MDDFIRKILEPSDKTPLHVALLNHCEDLLKKSRAAMQNHYAGWDERHEVYMRRRAPSQDNIEALRQGLPRKIVVPLSYSQINTAVAYGYMLFTQRERFYELTPVEDNDQNLRECCELVLHRDLLATDYKKRLVQTLLDVCRFGISVEVDSWEEEYVWVPVETMSEPTMFQGQPSEDAKVITKVEKMLRRQGNTIRTISPYRVFLDPGFHPNDWRRGSFVGWDDEFSKNALKTMQAGGDAIGIEHIKDYDFATAKSFNREKARFSGLSVKDNKTDVVCVTQLVINLIPAEIKDINGNQLGAETMPHKWIIWIANDNRIIRAEPAKNLHASFPVSIGFFAPDMHEAMFNSLSYIIDDLQALTSWLMNSRMAAVTRTIDNQIIADPRMINVADIIGRQRLIRINKDASGKDLTRHVKQLEIRDTTAGHVADMGNLQALTQTVSGVNDNMMGLVASGRRSATENRAANTGASARMKMVFDVMWNEAYQPQANRLLINARQGMSIDELAIICGEQRAQAYYQQFKSTPQQLVRSYDFVTFDGTLPSEKLFLAQQLSEVLMQLLANPVAAAAFQMDPNKLQETIMELRGLGRGSNFKFDQVPQTLISALNLLHGPQPATGNATSDAA